MAQMTYDRDFQPVVFGTDVRWTAIFAGALTALITHVVLSLLGLAIGLSVINPADPNFSGISMGSGVWMLLAAVIATFMGGWVASLMANIAFRLDGILHGILTWGLLMLLTVFLLGSGVGSMLGGVFNLASSALAGSSQALTEQMGEQGGVQGLRQQFNQQANRLQQQMTPMSPEQQARVVDTAGQVAWWAFLASVFSLIAGAFGGLAGFRQHARLATRGPVQQETV